MDENTVYQHRLYSNYFEISSELREFGKTNHNLKRFQYSFSAISKFAFLKIILKSFMPDMPNSVFLETSVKENQQFRKHRTCASKTDIKQNLFQSKSCYHEILNIIFKIKMLLPEIALKQAFRTSIRMFFTHYHHIYVSIFYVLRYHVHLSYIFHVSRIFFNTTIAIFRTFYAPAPTLLQWYDVRYSLHWTKD